MLHLRFAVIPMSLIRAAAFAGLILLATFTAASAHDFRPPTNRSGYDIPSINHGAMAVIATYGARIITLAGSAGTQDPELQTLLLHNQMQAANCLWLWLPGSATDEESPLNECAHADLAGLKGILDRLRLLPQTSADAERLVSEIDRDMVLAGTSFVRCEYSGENFNTAEQVRPDWPAVIAYLASRYMLGVGFAIAMLVLGGFLILELIRWLQGRSMRCVAPTPAHNPAEKTRTD